MGGYSAQTAADRAGVEPGQIVRLAELGISAPDDDVGYTDADLRRVQVVRALERAGLELEGLADLLREGSEAEWWRSEVQTLLPARGEPADELGRRSAEISPRLSRATDRAPGGDLPCAADARVVGEHQDGITTALEQAGLHTRDERQPAMCFLDLTGFTQLTEELGDAEPARTIERSNRIVRPISVRHDGLPVKWLGDGVMFHFPDPGASVLAAIEMVGALAEAELPPAHVGLHAGPIVRQQGDYHGRTVNLAAPDRRVRPPRRGARQQDREGRVGSRAGGLPGGRERRAQRCIGRGGAVHRDAHIGRSTVIGKSFAVGQDPGPGH